MATVSPNFAKPPSFESTPERGCGGSKGPAAAHRAQDSFEIFPRVLRIHPLSVRASVGPYCCHQRSVFHANN
jgi:hypothetical protein